MKKAHLPTHVVRRLALLLMVALPATLPAAGFQVSGNQLLDSSGSPFIMRGVNHPHAWFTSELNTAIPAIAATGANTVRVVLSNGVRWTANGAAEVSSILDLIAANQMIAVVEVHDTTGYGEQAGAATLQSAVDYWISIQSALAGRENCVIINIGNEPFGNGTAAATYTNEHISAIQQLRSAGFSHALMVDASGWGQDWQNIMRDNAATILAGDPDGNTIFSVHMYDVYDNATIINDYIDYFYNNNLCLVIGEFASDHGSAGNVDEASIMARAEMRGTGYLGWSWKGNGAGLTTLDISNTWDGSSLTAWGDTLINGANGIAATSQPATGCWSSPPTLRAYADACGLRVGTAVVWSAFNSGPQIYRDTLSEFNLLECENETKFAEVHPSQFTYNYSKADQVIAFAQANGQEMRGHVLAWHQDNPGWLTGGGFNSAQLTTILQDHVNTVLGYFDGKMYAWDIVNEAFNEDGSTRSSIWYDSPGINTPDATGPAATNWIEQVFRWARAADPDLELYYNDYNNEAAGYAKADAVYNMAVDFVARGVPLDGIGMQMHVVAGSGWPNPNDIRTQINRITALGLKVEITELDVRIQEPVDAAKLAQQAATAQAILDACLDNPDCQTIQWWGHTDNYSWIPTTFPGYNDGLLLDRSYAKKPVYDTFLAELQSHCGAPGTPTPSPTATPVPFGVLLDDFEDLDTTNNWGGGWFSYQGAGSTVALSVAAPGAPGSTAGRALATGTITDYGGVSTNLAASGSVDISGYVGVRFQVRGTGTYWFQVPTNTVTDGAHWGQNFVATGSWTTVELYFADFNQPGWAAGEPFGLNVATSLQWANQGNMTFDLEIDDVELLTFTPPVATATPSSTPSNSPSATPTASPSATPTVTETNTPTATPSSSATPSASATLSVTATLTATLSATETATASETASATPTVSLTETMQDSPTETPLASATSTPTVSLTETMQDSPTETPLASATATPTVSLTETPQDSPTQTPVASPTASATVSSTQTQTLSPTVSQTVSMTTTVSETASPTASPTAMIVDAAFAWAPSSLTVTVGTTVTWAWSGFHNVVSDSAEPFGSGAAVAGGSYAYTFNSAGAFPYYCGVHGGSGGAGMYGWIYVIDPGASPTPSVTPTFSVTSSATYSSTATLTASPSPTASWTATVTPTPSLTASPTATVSRTETFTATFSRTASLTPTPTGSVTVTVTSVVSPTFSVTHSPSATVSVTVSPTPSFSPSPAGTGTITATPTVTAAEDAILEISRALLVPNPWGAEGSAGAALHFQLVSRAQRLEWKLYSAALTRLREGRVDQACSAGWNELPLDLDGLANGIYFVSLRAGRENGAWSQVRLIKLMILR